MTTQADYTEEEYQTLVMAIAQAGMAVAMASYSGIWGTLKEVMSSATSAVKEAQHAYQGNELVQDIVAKLSDKESGLQDELKARAEADQANVDKSKSKEEMMAEVIEKALASVKEAGEIVDAKTSAEEAAGYKQWLVAIATDVASASKEGGFLGIGGTRVSEEETVMIGRVKEVLGV